MYYHNDAITEIEDLVMDFLAYRKTRRVGYNVQSMHEVGRGWPYNKNFLPLEAQEAQLPQMPQRPQQGQQPMQPIQRPQQPMQPMQPQQPMQPMQPQQPGSDMFFGEPDDFDNPQNPQNPIEGMLPQPLNDGYNENEVEFIRQLYSEIAKQIQPFVEQVLDEYEYNGSPIYDEFLDKESMAQIVDKVADLVFANVAEASQIGAESYRQPWTMYRMFRTVVELLVLSEIYWRRRPVNRRFNQAGI